MQEVYFATIHSNNQSIRNVVPNSLQPSLFVTFAYDNGDHNAESLFVTIVYDNGDHNAESLFVTFVYDNGGHNAESLIGSSLHCTNGITLQSIQCRVTLRSRLLSRKKDGSILFH